MATKRQGVRRRLFVTAASGMHPLASPYANLHKWLHLLTAEGLDTALGPATYSASDLDGQNPFSDILATFLSGFDLHTESSSPSDLGSFLIFYSILLIFV